MYVKKASGFIFAEKSAIGQLKGLLGTYSPETFTSVRWKYWKATLDPKLCPDCLSHHGKLYSMDEIPDMKPPLHDNCRCAILPLEAIMPGGAAKGGEHGADYWSAHYGRLPDYYISDDVFRRCIS